MNLKAIMFIYYLFRAMQKVKKAIEVISNEIIFDDYIINWYSINII